MSEIARLLTVYAVYLLAAMAPGPAVFYVMRTAISSRRRGLRAAWGVATGTAIWVCVAAFGLSVALKNCPLTARAVRALGGAVFLHMCWRLGRVAASPAAPEEGTDFSPRSLWSAYSHGVAVNTTNPATAFFFAGLLGLYQVEQMPAWAQIAAYAGIVVLSVGWYSSVALVFSHPRLARAYLRLRRPPDAILAVLFLALAIELLRSALG